jgi:hypothetical protein
VRTVLFCPFFCYFRTSRVGQAWADDNGKLATCRHGADGGGETVKKCAAMGRNKGSSTSAPSSSAATLLSSSRALRSQRSYSDTSLCASSLAGARTRLPTSIVERKSSTALLHLSSASRSRTFQRLFHLPVSFPASHKVFRCTFHAGHTLKQCSRVCVLHGHPQNYRWVDSLSSSGIAQ